MVTETLGVRVVEVGSGARVVKRRIDEIGYAADRATHSIYLMRRSLWVLGGAGLLRGLINQLDTLTNYENRLKLTTSSAANLQRVQDELFGVAKDTRTGFEAVSDIYSRTALSARQLGKSQQEVLDFTSSLSKATILSGASAREANAAMIQLGQGMASNRLSGDELRSVLEQLPYVADIIAKEITNMGIAGEVTRGDLRKLGRDGKITADVLFEAFKNAKGEIDAAFAETVPTIGQAFSVLRTNWLQFLDGFKDSTGVADKLAQAILLVAENIDLIIYSATALAATLGTIFVVGKVQSYAAALTLPIERMNRLKEVELLRAQANMTRTAAQVRANAVELTSARIGAMQLQQNITRIQQERAKAIAYHSSLSAIAKNTGSTAGLAAAQQRVNDSTRALIVSQQALRGTLAQVTALETAQAGAAGRLASANTALAGATAASNTMSAKLARNFPLIAGAIAAVRTAFIGLTAAMLANPFVAIATAIALATVALFKWGNELKVTADGVVGLKDWVVAAFQLMAEAISWPFDQLARLAGPVLTGVASDFASMAGKAVGYLDDVMFMVIDVFTFLPRAAGAGVAGIIAAMDMLPAAAAAAGAGMANVIIAAAEWAANLAIKAFNGIIAVLNSIASFAGFGTIGFADSVELGRFEANMDAAGGAVEKFSETYNAAMEETSARNVLTSAADAVTDRARENIENRKGGELDGATEPTTKTDPAGTGGGGGGGGGGDSRSFSEILAGYDREIEALKLSNREREIANGLTEIEKELKRGLTAAEHDLADAKLRELQASQDQADLLESILGPREEIKAQQEALNALMDQGRISVQDYTTALRDLQKAADEASNSLFGGFRAAINDSIMTSQEFGSAIGGEVVNAVSGLTDSLIEFAETGEFSIREVFSTLFKNLFKLAANQLFMSLLGSLIGIPGAGLLGGAVGGGGGLLGFSSGGSIMPSGPGSTDSQLVAFNKRPDERVDILTPGQQAKKGQGDQPVQAAPPQVNVAVVMSEDDVAGAFASDAGSTQIVKAIERNKDSVKGVLS